jgi:hypothetical protein
MVRADKTSAALDAALKMTFPASDPIAVYMPEYVPAAAADEREERRCEIDSAEPRARAST